MPHTPSQVKTTAPKRYKVRPNVALVDSKSVAKVQVLFTPDAGPTSVSQDKFLIQTYTISPETSLPDIDQLIQFWKALPQKDITEHRYFTSLNTHCLFFCFQQKTETKFE